uniref:Uncharacterized protein MANES_14G144400 n=1 Tax=Rhizophora mucronata TaxID=61149 RepID=A0A2P2KHT0_RHIMU
MEDPLIHSDKNQAKLIVESPFEGVRSTWSIIIVRCCTRTLLQKTRPDQGVNRRSFQSVSKLFTCP